MSLTSLFLSSVSLKNADIKCLMLAYTTDVQIKTSPVRHDFFFFFLHFDNTFVVSVVSRFDSSFTFPPLFKTLDCFISFFFFPPEPQSHQNGGGKRENTLRFAYDFRNKCFPIECLLVFSRGCMQHDAVMPESGAGAGRGEVRQYES